MLIGMGAIVLNGARIGRGSLVAAGAVVLEGTQIPPRSLVAGVPRKVRRGDHRRGTAADNRQRREPHRELRARHAAAEE